MAGTDRVGRSEGARALPAARLRPYLASYDGYRMAGFEAGTHIGMPSPRLTVILAIDSKVEIVSSPRQGACAFETLASGISVAPVTIAHDGNQHGIQLSFTPAGARALFGIPAAALGDWMVDLSDVLPDAKELVDRVADRSDWNSRFDIVDEILCRSLREQDVDPQLSEAWSRLVDAGGSARVGDVAREVGWSRRHLINRFTAEFGVTPKDSARIARFDRSHQLLRRIEMPRLSDVAARCGYYDQAHMARDWRDLAGASPSRWRREEKFAFVQDADEEPEHNSVP
ncbi:AraC family transcriptional regulator [Rhodococcus sp. G-MC3]|uniref:helix-turn-helix domain-containing protein n=1 Tax=Rhodococcus sp. G-MC3 TaxID=3046209 RepID=UPI0024BB33E5|nr:AraC family transcriptional regulator [Rhodococcus sp. G-MC3]MDJ0392382.1 AraC family transcriptional regulator [Rhodococcus sp. G-MC3]